MAYSSLLLLTSLLLVVSTGHGQSSFRPKAVVLPVRKDASTEQYVTRINQRTPLVPVNLVLHLGGKFLWVDCDNDYVSSSYRPVHCRTAQCSLAGLTECFKCFGGPGPVATTTRAEWFRQPFIPIVSKDEISEDVVTVQSTDGTNPGRSATVPRFLFVCAPSFLLQGLARGTTGLAGLGRARIGMPSLFSQAFSFRRKFAICLSGLTAGDRVIFFVDGPYRLLWGLPKFDAAASLIYTPLLINPVSNATPYFEGGEPAAETSTEYFIRVNSIRINGNSVPINTTLLSIDSKGIGGTKISTVNPYTLLETSIYRAFTVAYVRETAGIRRVAGVAPFEVCYSSENIGSTRVGPAVPYIDLVLQGHC